MSDEMTREQAVAELTATLQKLKAADRVALVGAIDRALPPAAASASGAREKNLWLPYLAIILALLFGSLGVAAWIPQKPVPAGLEDKSLFAFIAFVVALASYLAATIREIVKSMGTASASARKEMKWNIFYAANAEGSLLLFGLILIFRVLHGGFQFRVLDVPSDHFILTYLSVLLVFLVALHLRIWTKTEPWKIPV